jgi:DNA-binding transcriptional MerR regulator
MPAKSSRLLSIGEFAAATQLSPKALRLYDEQRLLPPASVDALSGYRHYRSDQVPVGRFIRNLREMNLSLAQVADVIGSPRARAEMLLREYARDTDRRYAFEKRALQTALMTLRQASQGDTLRIDETTRPAMTMSVWPFLANQRRFVERYNAELSLARSRLESLGLEFAGLPRCSLADPLSDEEGRLEALVPIAVLNQVPPGLTLRHRPPAACAIVIVDCRSNHASELTAALDAIFDWFDQRGHRATEPPSVAIGPTESGMSIDVAWAYATNEA